MTKRLSEGNDPSTLSKYGIKPEHMARTRALVNSGHAPDVAARMIKKKFAYPGFTGLEKIKDDQLNELSNATLSSYKDKAQRSVHHNKNAAMKARDSANNTDFARGVLAKGGGQVPTGPGDSREREVARYGRIANQQRQSAAAHDAKATQRQKGVDTAINKLNRSVAEGAKVDRMVKHIEKSEVKAGKKKVKEGDIPSSAGVDTRGAGLGAGRSKTTLEAKKKVSETNKNIPHDDPAMEKGRKIQDYLDKEHIAKNKKKVKESMNHRISAARFEGKSHGLKGHSHCGKQYEDLEERKAYCEGYKDGLDECYGMGVYETSMPPATVGGMDDQALVDEMALLDDEMGEGNAFTGALARTPKGGNFSLGGRTYKDTSSLDEYAFESWDKQLNTLLNEGINVSVSKGNNNMPDTVSISATDEDAEQLLGLVKNAGLGLFGAEETPASMPMSTQPDGEPSEIGTAGVDIGVVDGSDSMMGMLQKLSGIEGASGDDEDYGDEGDDSENLYGNSDEHGDDSEEEETNEETCNECGGMMEANHSCGKMAEETDAEADEEAEAEEDKALAGADSDKEEEIDESFAAMLTRLSKLDEWANQTGRGPGKGTDAKFEQDTEFMTKTIAGGLNKPKSTGQTTTPVITAQMDRTFDSLNDLSKLAGIKK